MKHDDIMDTAVDIRRLHHFSRRNAHRDQIRLLALATFALPVGLWGHGPLCGVLTAICVGTIARAILLESRL